MREESVPRGNVHGQAPDPTRPSGLLPPVDTHSLAHTETDIDEIIENFAAYLAILEEWDEAERARNASNDQDACSDSC